MDLEAMRKALQQHIGPSPQVVISSFTNWASTQTVDHVFSVQPTTLDDVQRVILAARNVGLRVRAVGGGHSWSPLFADRGQVMLLTGRLTRHDGPLIEYRQNFKDPNNSELVVGSGVTVAQLKRFQLEYGVELPSNVIFLSGQIGGIVSTMSHGTGQFEQTVADYITSMRVVDSNGILRTFGMEDPEMLNAVRGSLGLFGVIYDVTFRVGPRTFCVSDDQWIPYEVVFDPANFQNIVAKNTTLEIFWIPLNSVTGWGIFKSFFTKRIPPRDWNPNKDEVWVRTVNAAASVGSLTDPSEAVEPAIFNVQQYMLGRKIVRRIPSLSPLILKTGKKLFEESFKGRKVLPLPDCVHFISDIEVLPAFEFEVTFALGEAGINLMWALQELKTLLQSLVASGQYPLNMLVELRITRTSDIYLSPTGPVQPGVKDTGLFAQLEIVSFQGTPKWFEFATLVAERWLQIPGAKPHWGKSWAFIPNIAQYLRKVYGANLAKFLEMLSKSGVDPGRMFFNQTLEETFLGGTNQTQTLAVQRTNGHNLAMTSHPQPHAQQPLYQHSVSAPPFYQQAVSQRPVNQRPVGQQLQQPVYQQPQQPFILY